MKKSKLSKSICNLMQSLDNDQIEQLSEVISNFDLDIQNYKTRVENLENKLKFQQHAVKTHNEKYNYLINQISQAAPGIH